VIERHDDGTVSLNAEGESELARAAGFDTYDDFVCWKTEKPEEYERWYRDLVARATRDDA
jgi:hypothetical protein